MVLASTTLACPADLDDGSGTGTPDGGVTIEDLLYFLQVYESCPACTCSLLPAWVSECTQCGGAGDCSEDFSLLIEYLTLYLEGC